MFQREKAKKLRTAATTRWKTTTKLSLEKDTSTAGGNHWSNVCGGHDSAKEEGLGTKGHSACIVRERRQRNMLVGEERRWKKEKKENGRCLPGKRIG